MTIAANNFFDGDLAAASESNTSGDDKHADGVKGDAKYDPCWGRRNNWASQSMQWKRDGPQTFAPAVAPSRTCMGTTSAAASAKLGATSVSRSASPLLSAPLWAFVFFAFALRMHATRLSTLLVAGGALPVLSGWGARRRGPISSALLLLFSRGSSAATICTHAGTDYWGNTVTAGSLCDGSWVGDSTGDCIFGPCSTSLDLYDKGLTGTVPTELMLLTQLTHLYLFNNDLSGTVPTELALLTQLTILDLSGNDLSGTVPTEVGLMTSLTRPYLDRNSLSGSLPSQIGQLTKLEELLLEDNQFGGSLPSQIGQLTKLYTLGLYNNSFDGTIPQELANLSPDYCDLGGTNSWLCPLPDPPLDSDCLAGYFTPDLSCTPSADEDSSLGAIVGGVVGAVALVAVVVGGFFAYKKMKKAPAAAPPSTVDQANVAVEMAPSPIPQAR